jgi:hypothetical protein
MQSNSTETAPTFSSAFGLVAIINKLLELGAWNLVRRLNIVYIALEILFVRE